LLFKKNDGFAYIYGRDKSFRPIVYIDFNKIMKYKKTN